MVDVRGFKNGYHSDTVNTGFKTWNSESKRWFMNPDAFAGLLGAMLDCNINYLGFNGASKIDGSPSPSKSHRNGVCLDITYLSKNQDGERTLLQDSHFDYDNQKLFNHSLYKYGWSKRDKGSMCSEHFMFEEKSVILFKTSHLSDPRHNNHLHLGGFNFENIIIQEEK